MAAPATPAGFYLVSAQAQVLLYWEAAATATSYLIFRSPDNTTFTQIGTTASLSYSDSTGTIGTIYYYRIEATNGIASAPTSSLAGVPLNPGQTTVGNIRIICKQQCDLVKSKFISDQEWNSMISLSYKELYDLLIQKFGNDYFIAPPVSYLTTGQLDPTYNAQVFPLPPDFYKLMRCEVALNPGDPNSWITLKQFNAIQANLWNFPNVYTMYGITNLRYRLWGTNLQIVPISSAGQTIRIWYSPKPNQLVNDTDTLDMTSGWEEYIVADVDVKAMIKEESDPSPYMAQKAALKQRIEEAAENRNVGEPQTVSDSKTRNFSWGDSGGEYGGGSGFY